MIDHRAAPTGHSIPVVGTDVCRRVLLMSARGGPRASGGQFNRGAVLRRVAVTVVAGALVVAAELAATLSPAPVARPRREHRTAIARPIPLAPAPGEPMLAPTSTVPPAPRSAAARFVHDYALWSSRSVRTISASDATRRVLLMLGNEGTRRVVDVNRAVASVRLAPAPGGRYVVTSAIGNFLVGRQRSRWIVISLPGD